MRGEFDTAYTPMLPEVVATLLDAYGHVARRMPTCRSARGWRSSTAPAHRACRSSDRLRRGARRGPRGGPGTLDEVDLRRLRLFVQRRAGPARYRRACSRPRGRDLVEAAATAARVVNPFRARVANNKKLLALFQDPRFAHLLVRDEADLIARTIPWTRILARAA